MKTSVETQLGIMEDVTQTLEYLISIRPSAAPKILYTIAEKKVNIIFWIVNSDLSISHQDAKYCWIFSNRWIFRVSDSSGWNLHFQRTSLYQHSEESPQNETVRNSACMMTKCMQGFKSRCNLINRVFFYHHIWNLYFSPSMVEDLALPIWFLFFVTWKYHWAALFE